MTFTKHIQKIYPKKNTRWLMWTCLPCGNPLYEPADKPLADLQGKERVCRTCGCGWVIGIDSENRLVAVQA